MIKLNGRKIDEYGTVVFDEEGLCKALLEGFEIENLIADSNDKIKRFNNLYKEWDNGEQCVICYEPQSISVEEYHKKRQNTWLIQDSKELQVEEWLFAQCKTTEEVNRVALELALFAERELFPVLSFLIFLVNHFRTKGIVWGVGRGSSAASYCLYLIGVHRINSLKYNLDIREFLK